MTKMKWRKKTKTSRITISASMAVQTAVRMLLCFISARACLAGRPSPLGIAVMSTAGPGAVFCYLSAMAGMAVFKTLRYRIFNAAAMTLVLAAESLYSLSRLGRSKENRIPPLSAAVITGGGMMIALLMVAYSFELTASDWLYLLLCSALCSLLTYFAQSAAERASADGLLDINGVNGASLGALYVAVISLLTSVDALGFNLGRVCGGVLLLCAATKYKHIGGAVCGALTTCGAVLCSVDSAGNTMLLATAGLLCGAVSAVGSFAMVLSFLIASVTGLAVIGVNADTFNMLRDVFASAVVFCCIPSGTVGKLLNRVGGETNAVSIVGQAASSRLNFASKTLGGIRCQLDEIADVIKKKSVKSDIQTAAGNKVCLECSGCKLCWNENTSETVGAFSALESRVENTGRIDVKDVRCCLPECLRAAELSGAFNTLYQQKLFEYTNGVRAGELRETVTQQLSAMEDILSDLSHRIAQMSSVDTSLSEKVRAAAVRLGCKNARACVSCDENRNYRAELFIPNLSRVDMVKLTVAVSDILDIDMELPTATAADGITKLTFAPCPAYKLEIGVWQSSGEEDEYCGDTVELVEISSCEQYVVLSDGMGTGKRAKLDSTLAAGLARKLLKTGVTCQTGVRMINSVMRVKGWEESFSTLDAAHFDLRRGICEFVKAGAASSFLIRDETIRTFAMDSLPLGILPETDASCERVKLFSGDLVVMASDGVGDSPEKSILLSAVENPQLGTDELASEIGCRLAPANCKARRDDMTVVVVRVCEIVN